MVDFAKALQKNKTHFDKLVAFDCETSGLNFDTLDPSTGYRMISAGLIVATSDFEPTEELYVEFKWTDNEISQWSDYAAKIHGLSKAYLNEHGVTDVEAAEKIGGLLYEHFGMETPITLLGTNVGTFDYPFLRNFLTSMSIPFKFSHRFLDTFSLGYGTVKAYTSDELFDILGFKKRGDHNALEDARMSLKSFKLLHSLWQSEIG